MNNNLRDTVNQFARHQAALRDQQIEFVGIKAEIRYKLDDSVDLYGDPESGLMFDDTIPCIPLYEAYFKMLNTKGVSVELELPLEIIFPSTAFVPQNAELTLPAFRLPTGEFSEDRVWLVKGIDVKRFEETFELKATCVPKRDFTVEDDSDTDEPDILTYDRAVVVIEDIEDEETVVVDYGV